MENDRMNAEHTSDDKEQNKTTFHPLFDSFVRFETLKHNWLSLLEMIGFYEHFILVYEIVTMV